MNEWCGAFVSLFISFVRLWFLLLFFFRLSFSSSTAFCFGSMRNLNMPFTALKYIHIKCLIMPFLIIIWKLSLCVQLPCSSHLNNYFGWKCNLPIAALQHLMFDAFQIANSWAISLRSFCYFAFVHIYFCSNSSFKCCSNRKKSKWNLHSLSEATTENCI